MTEPTANYGRLEQRHMALLVTLAALARLTFLARAAPDAAEAICWFLARSALDGAAVGQTLGFGAEPPLHAAVNVVSAWLLGPSIVALRVPAAVFGILTVALFYDVVLRLHSPRVAFGAGLLAALSPFLVYVSKGATPHSQALFFCMLFVWGFLRTEGWNGRHRRGALIGFAGLLAVAGHDYSLGFLAAFFILVLNCHRQSGRGNALRRDRAVALWTAAFVLPLLVPFAVKRLVEGAMPQAGSTTLVEIVGEQLLFTGSSGFSGSLVLTTTFALVFLLLLLPAARALVEGAGSLASHPLLVWGWLAAPVLVVAVDASIGGSRLAGPHAFVASAPFLFSYLIIAFDGLAHRPLLRAVWTALLGLPFLAASLLVIAGDPRHVSYGQRAVMGDVAEQARQIEDRFDRVVVHHWMGAPLFAYHFGEGDRVVAAGLFHRAIAARHGEAQAVIAAVDEIPAHERILLLVNAIADLVVDPQGAVRAHLESTRPLEATYDCRPAWSDGPSHLCERMLLFGAVPGAEPLPPLAPATPLRRRGLAIPG